jgi:hypothetical protein
MFVLLAGSRWDRERRLDADGCFRAASDERPCFFPVSSLDQKPAFMLANPPMVCCKLA